MRKFVLGIILCALTMHLASAQRTPPVGLPKGAQLSSRPIPRRMMYYFFLRRVNQYATDPSSADPVNPNGLETFFSRQIGLNEDDNSTLTKSASTCVVSVTAQDAKAQQLIDKVHAQNPGGKLKFGQTPPPVPPELVEMQTNRDKLMDSCISNLQGSLPVSTFTAVDTYVTQVFGAQTSLLRVPDPSASKSGVR